MAKNKKIAWIVGSTVAILAVVALSVVLVLQGCANAAAEKGDRTRERLKNTFLANINLYNDAFEMASQDRYKGREYCIILTDGDATAKIRYESVGVGSEELENSLRKFASETGVDVVYANGDAVYCKIFFQSGQNQKSEANIIHFFGDGTPTVEDCTPLQDGWYYRETAID